MSQELNTIKQQQQDDHRKIAQFTTGGKKGFDTSQSLQTFYVDIRLYSSMYSLEQLIFIPDLHLTSLNDGGSGLRLNDGLDIKLSQVGWGLMLCLWPSPPLFN